MSQLSDIAVSNMAMVGFSMVILRHACFQLLGKPVPLHQFNHALIPDTSGAAVSIQFTLFPGEFLPMILISEQGAERSHGNHR